jgi:hypothetical protein
MRAQRKASVAIASGRRCLGELPISPLLLLVDVRCARVRDSGRAKPRVGRPVRAPASALALRAKVPCAAHAPRAAPPLGLAWPARRSRVAPMLGPRHARRRAAARCGVAMPLGALRCSAPSTRARACPPAAMPAPPWHTRGASRSRQQSRGWVCAGSDICGGEERRARGRARSAQRVLTRRDCLSAANAVSVASFATGRETEYRREPFAQRRAAASERRRIPARGFARSCARKLRP